MNFLYLFFYNRNVYAIQSEDGSYIQRTGPITEELLANHLAGDLALACYPSLNDMCTYGVLRLSKNFFGKVFEVLSKNLGLLDQQVYIQKNESDDMHLWLFFEEPVLASQVTQLFTYCLDKVNNASDAQILPNQFHIYPDNTVELIDNFLTLPFCGSKDGTNSVFYDVYGNTLSSDNFKPVLISAVNFYRILRKAHVIPSAIHAPVIEEDLQLLFDRCERISQLFAHPEGITDEVWIGICTNLYQLGEIGIEYLRDFSQHFFTDWSEEKFNRMLRDIDNTSLYSCHQLGCNKHCMVGAPIRHLQDPSININMTNNEDVTIDDVRQYNIAVNASLLNDYTPSIILNNGFPGVGKTEILAKQLLESGYSVSWMAPNHEQADQVMQIWGDMAIHLKSREQVFKNREQDCPYLQDIKQAFIQGLPARTMYCKPNYCENYDECPYLKLYQEAHTARLVLCMHQHNMYGTVEDLNKDICVIDENPAPCLRRNISIKSRDISYSIRLTHFIKDLRLSSHIYDTLERLKNEKKLVFFKPPGPLEKARISNAIGRPSLYLNTGEGKWLLNDLEYLADSHEPVYFKDGNFVYSRKSWIPKDRPVFILDATLKVEHLRMLLPQHDIISLNYDVLPKQQCEVTHVIGATYGASSLFSKVKDKDLNKDKEKIILKPAARRMLDSIEQNIGADASVITLKSLVKNSDMENRFANVGWYGNTRGINKFQESNKLVIFGFWMKPVNVIVREAFEHHGILDFDFGQEIHQAEIDLETPYEDIQRIIGATNLHDRYPGRIFRFTNPYIQSYFDYSVLAELSQAVGRARIYEPRNKEKEVWIITDVMPSYVQANRWMHKNELMPDIRKVNSKEAIREAIKLTDNPNSPQQIHKTLVQLGVKISLRTVKRYYKEVNE